jgi:hypothetical protein
VILFRNCQDVALFGCDLSHAFVANGIKSPSTVLLYLEVRVLNSIRIAMFNNVQQFVIGSRPITSVGNLAGIRFKQLNCLLPCLPSRARRTCRTLIHGAVI